MVREAEKNPVPQAIPAVPALKRGNEDGTSVSAALLDAAGGLLLLGAVAGSAGAAAL
jgi:hypothetical protein